MFNDIFEVIKKLKQDTNNQSDFVYRKKKIGKTDIYIIYLEPLTSSDKISDFIIRSLTDIARNSKFKRNVFESIENNISNFKVIRTDSYKQLCEYLHNGFTILLAENYDYALVLETRADLSRSINTPNTETTIRGPKDCFVEDYQKNMGLIRKRIKTNDLWIEPLKIGKYTNTQVSVLYIKSVVKKKLVDNVVAKLKTLEIDGIVNSGTLKNLLSNDVKTIFPTIYTTERPDMATNALLRGKVIILIDNCPYVLIIPSTLNDFFMTPEDSYAKSFNASLIRILKYIAFVIALTAPAIYIALTTYNQEMLPPELLISFAIQKDTVPFPAFVEAIMMITAFEIIREADLRVPGFTGSSLSIVGALILGEAAVNAGIVSPIMIIIVALTALSSLPFTEPEIINAIRWWRLVFMLGASLLGIIGVIYAFILLCIKISSVEIFGTPYLAPFVPTFKEGLKNSIIKLPLKYLTKRPKYLSDNTTKEVIHEEN